MAKKSFLAHLQARLLNPPRDSTQKAVSQAASAIDTIAPGSFPTPPFSTPSNPQLQSPLFSTLPAELRNRIFILATTAYPDPQRPYAIEGWQFRTDTPCHLRITTALLLTCRRAYGEARLLPVANNKHTFWYPDKGDALSGNRLSYLAKYPVELRQHISAVHLIGQYGELLSSLHAALGFVDEIGAQLKWLKITFRYIGKIRLPEKPAQLIRALDMRGWERVRRLEQNTAVPDSPSQDIVEYFRCQFLKAHKLEHFEIEIEVPGAKRAELDGLLEQLERHRIRVAEAKELVPVRRNESWEWMRDTDWPMWSRPVFRKKISSEKEIWETARQKFCVQSAIWRVGA